MLESQIKAVIQMDKILLFHTQGWLPHWPFDHVVVICFSIHFPLEEESLLFLSSSQKLLPTPGCLGHFQSVLTQKKGLSIT